MLYSQRWVDGKWAMHNDELLPLLGITNGKLPKEGIPPQVILGVEVYVNPFVPHPNGRKSSKHRIMAVCPVCKRTMSAGRLASQHFKHAHPNG